MQDFNGHKKGDWRRNLMQKTLGRKCLAVGIILLFVGLVVIPCINANICKTSSNELVKFTTDWHRLHNENGISYKFCIVKSGDVQHRNYQGRFYGIPISNPEIHEFGIGTFQLDLLGSDNSSEMRLKIAQFLETAFYYQDVRIYVKTFVGCFQPTGGLSGGILSGFALNITVYFLNNS